MRHWLKIIALTLCTTSGAAPTWDCEEQLVLPGLFAPVEVPAVSSPFSDLALALARGVSFRTLDSESRLEQIRRQLGPEIFVTTLSAAAAPGGVGRRLVSSEWNRLGLESSRSRVIYGASAKDFEEYGADLFHTLADQAGQTAVGEHVLRGMGLDLEVYGALGQTFADLAEAFAIRVPGDSPDLDLMTAWDIQDQDAMLAVDGPLARAKMNHRPAIYGLQGLISSVLTIAGEPDGRLYRAALRRRGALAVIRLPKGARLVPDRVHEVGSALIFDPEDARSSASLAAVIPLSQVDARDFQSLLSPARGIILAQPAARRARRR